MKWRETNDGLYCPSCAEGCGMIFVHNDSDTDHEEWPVRDFKIPGEHRCRRCSLNFYDTPKGILLRMNIIKHPMSEREWSVPTLKVDTLRLLTRWFARNKREVSVYLTAIEEVFNYDD